MDIEEFGEALKEFADDLIVIEDEDDFLIYRKTPDGPEYAGSVSSFEVELYEVEEIVKNLR